jgi:hypothetical protein
MRCLLSACLTVLLIGAAEAHDFKMRVGQDTYVFDYDYTGRTINVYESKAGEP